MNNLWTELQENLSFVLVSGGIILAVALLSHFAERFLPQKRQITSARRVSIIGVCAAIATVLHILDFPVLFMAPGFYKLDFSEVPVLLCGFYLGPSATVACEGIKVLLKLLLKGTSTAFVGDFANLIVGCGMVLPAVIIYHINKSRKNAVIGLIAGTLIMTVFGSAFNAFYLIPKFSQLFHLPLENILAMGAQIYPAVKDLPSFVMFCVMPLNLVKGVVVSVLCLLLYKKTEKVLFSLSK